MSWVADVLDGLGVTGRDQGTSFPDGAAFRIEIPSVEGPKVLQAVLGAAEAEGGYQGGGGQPLFATAPRADGGVLLVRGDAQPDRRSCAGRHGFLRAGPGGVRACRDGHAVSDRRGWPVLHRMHVLQAPEGCDYDFLRAETPEQLAFVEPVIGRS